jgi:hypothetical protein
MANKEPDGRETDATREKASSTQGFDPRDTDHPAGEEQAAENAADDPPG